MELIYISINTLGGKCEMSINFKRIISITFISVLLLGTLVGVLNENQQMQKW